ncbi:hypothetical protein RDI58_001668 [Solanum bulbocastanum]|uniref:Uncharacterized protein n=1 Tax=Solanum bulbocastanum TaxID=147425 RepID=A0AAN8U5I1_SOLBU
MARGWGRGKGRPRQETILTLGSANGERLEPEGQKEEGEVSTNETVIGAPLITITEKGKAPIESWANLFAKNRSITNGMALSYIPPQVIDGKSIIQLDKTGVARETAE